MLALWGHAFLTLTLQGQGERRMQYTSTEGAYIRSLFYPCLLIVQDKGTEKRLQTNAKDTPTDSSE